MKAEELRIGNLLVLSDTGESFTVTGMMLDSHGPKIYGQTYSGEYCSPRDNQCKPVILTEDWLLILGFENSKRTDKCFEKGTKVIVSTADDKFRFVTGNFIAQLVLREIKYVHQLQNLYFALTGDELTFADNHNQCTSDDPDDMCKNCTCWKATRKNCS